MATRSKKKKFVIRFELGMGGLLGVGILCFCIFLWMFLFGVWTGQTLLEPSGVKSSGLVEFAAKFWPKDKAKSIEVDLTKKKKPAQITQRRPDKQKDVPSVFSLQVAAFKDSDKARKVVLQWRARDFESFYLAPEQPNGSFFRVFIGSFDKMADAKKMSSKLEALAKNKFFITLIPAKEKRYP